MVHQTLLETFYFAVCKRPKRNTPSLRMLEIDKPHGLQLGSTVCLFVCFDLVWIILVLFLLFLRTGKLENKFHEMHANLK